jgi:hypothetical protein
MGPEQIIITIFFSIVLILFYVNGFFRKNSIMRIARWRKMVPAAVLINAVCFASVALYFNYLYGYITDDVGYFRGALTYTGGFFDIQNGNEFMYFITRPLRKYLYFDRASCHVFFGAIGFLGSFNFLHVLSKRTDFFNRKITKTLRMEMLTMLCFPNFMVWGRFYGKDSLTLFLGSIYLLGAFYLITGAKIQRRHLFLAGIPILLLYKLRPHIATVFLISLLIGMYLKSVKKRNFRSSNTRILNEVLVPFALTIALVIGSIYSLRNLTQSKSVSVENVQQTLIHATEIGAYGGSETELAQEFKENPDVILSPKQIVINVFMLLFAPLPWRIRGAGDMIAFLSNILLLILLVRYLKKVTLSDVFQKYLLVVCGSLILILSFMTGNVGLILRQKTILLPFLFLFLFRSKPSGAAIKPISGQTLPRTPAPFIQV